MPCLPAASWSSCLCCVCTHVCACARSCLCIRAHMSTHPHSHVHACTLTYLHMHARMSVHVRACSHACPRRCTFVRVHAPLGMHLGMRAHSLGTRSLKGSPSLVQELKVATHKGLPYSGLRMRDLSKVT